MPDQIDELGHMNVRHYGGNAYAGSLALCDTLGLGQPALQSAYTRHHNEQMEGNELEVRSALVGGSSRLRIYHELRNRANNDLAATFVHDLDHPPLHADMNAAPTVELPAYGQPRSLRLDVDGLASAPPLDKVRERGLAVRLPRTITTEDTMGADTVPPWLANNLIWNGERPDEETEWIRTLPNGDRYAFVVMESRLWVHPTPVALGTPVESFSTTVEIGEKVARDVSWSYNTETGEPLAAIEGIDLCFNLNERRSMVIPDQTRVQFERDLHPDFAPR